MLLALASCNKRAGNFPPDNTGVRLDSTNLPIVWIDVDGDSIMRDDVICGRMAIIDNGDGRVNYADTVAHPGQVVNYKGYISLRYRGNSTYNRRGGKKTQKNCTKNIFMTQITIMVQSLT